MGKSYIIEVTDAGRKAFITEAAGELYLTLQQEEAARYPSELDAKCAMVYIGDRYQPKLVPADPCVLQELP
jgi:hypothetical protein